ncbi:MAG TPA: 1-acyl-sn-glycerol-3-phosphate acyltransferase [Cyanobacteria bacterium UBA8803]|nr:1-acyl-sn-glycerol-3-phosphate acyltransferase [Cyanobacteria bacterium UBA9273]HBL58911.1 1-acyl-sn-glycerol-3-phosphate acyltransferase [Cyanobacteria bacterium UBA8803]
MQFPQATSIAPWLYWPLFPIHRIFLKLYFGQIVIQGQENLPESGPCVFAPKHFSRWDPVVLALLSTEPLYFLTNANQFEGFQGWLIQRLGAFPVELNHPTVSSLRCAIQLLQAGKKLVLFPEGGIVRDQPLRPLKTGLARLVLQAEAMAPEAVTIPIIPIALRYEPGAEPRAKVFIHISPPLYTQDYRQNHDKRTATALTQALQESLLKGLENI